MVEEKEKTIVEAEDMLKSCRLCPRVCKVNRIEGERGYCGADAQMRIARADLHFWEEPCISAKSGSGAVFFSGCNLRCVFCQNHEIAEQLKGKSFSPLQLAESFLMLEKKGANNINLVTASPYLPQLILAIRQAKEMGLGIPIVYNSSGYENPEAIQLLDGMIDIYLPDFKYMDREMAKAYSNAQDYPDRAKEALADRLGEGRSISLVRELTKLHEEVWRTTLGEAAQAYGGDEKKARGEYVLVIEGRDRQELLDEKRGEWDMMSIPEHVRLYEERGDDKKTAMKKVAQERGISKRDVYRECLEE